MGADAAPAAAPPPAFLPAAAFRFFAGPAPAQEDGRTGDLHRERESESE